MAAGRRSELLVEFLWLGEVFSDVVFAGMGVGLGPLGTLRDQSDRLVEVASRVGGCGGRCALPSLLDDPRWCRLPAAEAGTSDTEQGSGPMLGRRWPCRCAASIGGTTKSRGPWPSQGGSYGRRCQRPCRCAARQRQRQRQRPCRCAARRRQLRRRDGLPRPLHCRGVDGASRCGVDDAESRCGAGHTPKHSATHATGDGPTASPRGEA